MCLAKHLSTLLLALGGLGLLSCGAENRVEALANALALPGIVETDLKVNGPFEILPPEDEYTFLGRFELPDAVAELRVANRVNAHEIRLDFGGERLFEQKTDWNGELLAVRLYGQDVPESLAEGEEATMTMRYMLACTEEGGWRCYIEALDVLAHLGFAATDVYPTLGIEKAALGLHRLAPFAEP